MKRKRIQSVIDFGVKALKYCSQCAISYNCTNANDIAFHKRIHNGLRTPRLGQIAKYIYKQGRRYMYGRRTIEAWIEMELQDGLFIIKERWSSGPEATDALMNFIKIKYKALLNYK